MERMVLDAVADFLGDAGFACEGFPGPPKVAIGYDGNNAALPLAPHEAVERGGTDGLRWVFRRREEPAMLVRDHGVDKLGRQRGHWNSVRFSVLGLRPVDDFFLPVPLVLVQARDLLDPLAG